jgi:16S rRNA (guanine527-N7)-methyltransferase
MKLENKKALREIVQEFSLKDLQSEQFRIFVNLLESWSSRTNLISKNDVSRIVSKHIGESLEVERLSLLRDNLKIMDLGAGAGFPGVPLAILHPNSQFTLIDSRRKKSLFLQEVADECNLKNIHVVCDRVEDFGASLSPQYDLVLARAVAALDVLWRWASPILNQDGALVAIKGGDVREEVSQLLVSADVNVETLSFRGEQLSSFESKKIVVATFK